MTAAGKARDALEQVAPMRFTCVPNSEETGSALLMSDDLDRLCRAASEADGVHDDDWCDREGSEIAGRVSLSVNLAAPLAAVVRAAMEWREAADAFDDDFSIKSAETLNASEVAMRAALDAFNAAAQEMFGKETT